jgi:anti-anti-sigma factor
MSVIFTNIFAGIRAGANGADMEITTSLAEGRVPVTVVHLKGNFDSNSVEAYNQAILKILGSGTKDILMDMGGVVFMSSVGIRAISSLYDQLHANYSPEEKKAVLEATRAGTYRAPHLKICAPQKNVLEIIKMVNLDWYIQIFPSEKEAVAAF